jgi:hypothetical protein
MTQPKRRIRIVDTLDEQLALWLRGKSVHVRSVRHGESPQCCPDFSCCVPELLQPGPVRIAFVSFPGDRDEMLVRFLGALLERQSHGTVYITDGTTRIMSHGRKP